MKRLLATFCFLALVAGCNSSTSSGSARSGPDQAALEAQAVAKIGCGFENKARCAHLIENRLLFNRFFQPEVVSRMSENEVVKGRRVTTKFVAETAASIQQCVPVTAESVIIINNIVLAGKPYSVRGTAPLDETASTCFLSQPKEAS